MQSSALDKLDPDCEILHLTSISESSHGNFAGVFESKYVGEIAVFIFASEVPNLT